RRAPALRMAVQPGVGFRHLEAGLWAGLGVGGAGLGGEGAGAGAIAAGGKGAGQGEAGGGEGGGVAGRGGANGKGGLEQRDRAGGGLPAELDFAEAEQGRGDLRVLGAERLLFDSERALEFGGGKVELAEAAVGVAAAGQKQAAQLMGGGED